jgi:NAD(P)-dependent dehydrogenase (short-subunit alcohol dehydrogenase family)
MSIPYFDLKGKTAIISGGATGIGRGIAEGLAEAGANIAIAARRLEKCEKACMEIEEKTGVRTLSHRCDITRVREIEDLVDDVMEAFDRIDILVNNAGTGGSEKPVLKMSDEDWDHVLDTNLRGVFLLSRAVAGMMVRGGNGGKIINVASIGGLIGWPHMASYCASKGGCIQLTKVMALEWARYNIQVNAILPGYFETPMNREFFASDAGKKVIQSNIPMRRLAKTEEIKGLAVLLASRASSYMTGSAVVIDGGQTIW